MSYIGKKFNRLRILSDAPSRQKPCGQKEQMVKCICDCGEYTTKRLHSVLHELTKSCGCFNKEATSKKNRTHGKSPRCLYTQWCSMRQRCQDKSHKHYGARGIKVCDEWADFIIYRTWALENGFKKGLNIDRINNNGGYSPSNCRFVTPKINQRNRSNNNMITIKGETKCLAEWLEYINISRSTYYSRRRYGWSVEKALTTKTQTTYR